MRTEVRPPAEPPLVTPPRPRRRVRLLPRSVLGLSVLILFTALGAAFSGAVLYSYFQYRLDQNQRDINRVTARAAKSLNGAQAIIAKATADGQREIDDRIRPIRDIAQSEQTLGQLAARVGPSVWSVRTLDEAGQPSVGSAFVVASDKDQSYLLTSLGPLRAATHSPGPDVMVRKGNEELKATLWTWQEERDLALLVVDRPGLRRLPWASGASAPRLGERAFAVSGLSAGPAALTQGSVADVSADAVQHSVPVGQPFRGGPLIDVDGRVLAVASVDYTPLGFSGGAVPFAVPVARACETVLHCPDNGAPAPGAQRP